MSNVALVAGFTRNQQMRGLRPRTIARRALVFSNLTDYVADADLLSLTSGDIEAWLDSSPRGDRTRYSYLSTTSCFYDWAIETELTDHNPVAKVPRPRMTRCLPRPIGRDDLDLALRLAPPMIRAWLHLAAFTGLRCQEIATLEREDVWDQEDEPMLFVRDGKGGHQRVIPLHPETLNALRYHGLPRVGPVFRTDDGFPYAPDRVSRLGNDYLRSLDIDATMHQLRHRFGTDIQALGKDIRITQELLGHQSTQSTAIYTAVNPVHAAAIVRLLTARPALSLVPAVT